ncbi:helix-turn-helix domain-containing protein [Flagellimonas pelagia]|uniref:ImmA/IrrE family metallo-endopeptidase n=1 Tax=Flagellimonas pelagia TaxID=2306998 RepID=A0A3A1NHC1_9FLAO|nr:XRE family transcriptional regulator [Allomuricauda maritima]RIV44675.1 ImmA/IrrE family metallo-endopeptidase [Allomuricauda maritima]TXJ94738.1 ImmA/IrrE family metallo-endopeptidase [Allomuricauda maritima]
MKELFSKRLKNARLLSAMSQDNLVKAMGDIVSKNAISKYEKGEMMPNSATLIQLAKALNVKPDYFFRPLGAEIEKIEFRKRSILGVKKTNAIKQQVAESVERYLEIEDLLQIKSAFVNPIKNVLISTVPDIENAVNALLKAWKLGINALPNVIEILEDKEIKVIELDADLAFDGLSGWADGSVPIIVINKNYSIERKRFTALHELGHILLNFSEALSEKEIERLCHAFAGAMLIPYETFITELGSKKRKGISIPELISIKETYGISIQAIMARAKNLEIIDEHRYVKFRKYISANREEEGLGQYKGKEHSDRFMQLVYRAASEEIISLSKAANLSNEKLAVFRDQFIAI